MMMIDGDGNSDPKKEEEQKLDDVRCRIYGHTFIVGNSLYAQCVNCGKPLEPVNPSEVPADIKGSGIPLKYVSPGSS